MNPPSDEHIVGLGQALLAKLPLIFPATIGSNAASPRRDPAPPLPEKYARTSVALPAPMSGYLRSIDGDLLLTLARRYDLVIHISHRPGRFLLHDAPMAHAHPASRATLEARQQLQGAFHMSPQRLDDSEPESIITQLVQIACRSLSPAMTDPFTTIACVEWLGAGLRALTGQALPSPFRNDAEGALCVVAPSTSFSELAELSFSEIRYWSAGTPAVVLRLFDQAAELARFARRSEDRRWLAAHIRSLQEASHQHMLGRAERARLEQAWKAAAHAIGIDTPDAPSEDR